MDHKLDRLIRRLLLQIAAINSTLEEANALGLKTLAAEQEKMRGITRTKLNLVITRKETELITIELEAKDGQTSP